MNILLTSLDETFNLLTTSVNFTAAAERMAQWVAWLPYKREDMGWASQCLLKSGCSSAHLECQHLDSWMGDGKRRVLWSGVCSQCTETLSQNWQEDKNQDAMVSSDCTCTPVLGHACTHICTLIMHKHRTPSKMSSKTYEQ